MATAGGVPEIKVKLTPEGVAEVAAALRQIQAEAGAAAKTVAGGQDTVNSALREFRSLLPQLGLAATGAGLIALGRNALETADDFGKLAHAVGTTTEAFSVLAFAGATAKVDRQDLAKGLVVLINNIKELRLGTASQIEAFGALGLSAKDFIGVDAAQAFELVAKRVAGMGDSIEKTQIVSDIFGVKLGKNFINLLNDLGTRGFAAVRKEAERLGVVISEDLFRSSEKANDAVTLIKMQVKGLALEFVSGFAPSIANAMTQFREAISGDGVGAMNFFGQVVGKIIEGNIRAFLAAGETVGLFAALLGEKTHNLKSALIDLAKQASVGATSGALVGSVAGSVLPGVGNIAGAGIGATAGAIAGAVRSLVTPTTGAEKQIILLDSFRERVMEILKGVDPEQLASRKKALDNLLNSKNLNVNQQLAELYKISGDVEIKILSEISKKREEMVGKEVAYQKALAEARLAGSRDQINASKQITQVELNGIADRVRAATAGYTLETTLNLTKFEAAGRLIDKQVGDTKRGGQLQEALFRDTVKSQIGIAQGYYSDLQKLGSEYLARYKATQESIVALDKEIADNRASGEKIFRDLRLGTLSEVERRDAQINQADVEMAQLRQAVAAGDLDKARQLRGDITSIATDIARASNAPGGQAAAINLGERIFNEANQLLEVALLRQKANEASNAVTAQKGIVSAQQQLDAVKKALDSLNQQEVAIKVGVKDEALQALVTQIGVFLARNPFTIAVQPVVAAAGSTSGSIPSSVPGFAPGGLIPGISPHARADDKIIRATAGEFMQPVNAVRYYGSAFMESIRRMELPRYASGGPIGGGSAAGAPGSAGKMELSININRKGIGSVFGPRDTIVALADALREIDKA